jgi:hypothetical protein
MFAINCGETPLDRFLNALEAKDCKQHKNGSHQYRSQCPLHPNGDGSPLNIKSNRNGSVMFYCFHEYSNGKKTCKDKEQEILNALDLRWADLKPPGESGTYRKAHPTAAAVAVCYQKDLGRHSREFKYHDANGIHVLGSFRFDLEDRKKEFRPAHKDGDKWYSGLPKNPKLPLYHLVDILQRENDPVFVFEGEKCAEIGTVILKLLATTTISGSKSFTATTSWRSRPNSSPHFPTRSGIGSKA